jgi:ring-1,2-phenylacetyl-CoA epoxidase subunit PaaC
MNSKYNEALKELLYKIADDQLIIGHRNSEWTGLGPIIEEDIAFSSIAQDKIGQSRHFYELLHKLGEKNPDIIAFTRSEKDFRCCHLVEYPIGEYDFSLMRNFLFNNSEHIRFQMLCGSSCKELSGLAKKYTGEIKYHIMHADTWVNQLGNADVEANSRMQSALNECWNLALGIFEEGPYLEILREEKIFSGEEELKNSWLEVIIPKLEKASLKIPDTNTWEPSLGGRYGYHTEYLKPLLDEMCEVFRLDPEAEW